MTGAVHVFAEFPNPIGWVADRVAGAVSGTFEALLIGIVGWIVDAVIWVVAGVFNYFIDASDPNVQADWFLAEDGPYGTMLGIAAALMVGFLLVGITQGTLNGDVAGMLRRMALDLPVSVLGMTGLVTVTQLLIRLTDELSTAVMGNFEEDISDFIAVAVSLGRLNGAVGSLVIVILGLTTVLAGVILVAELTVRSALIYLVVALAPLVFAARLWPALQDVTKRLLQLLVALILSKLVMAAALAISAAAAVGTGSGGEVTTLPEPEVFAEDPGGSMTQAVGLLLAATTAFAVAAFSPLTVARLLPLTESAMAAQGIRGMPVRGVQQALNMAYYSQVLRSLRLGRLASGTPGKPARQPAPPGRPALPSGPPPPKALPAGSKQGPRALGRGPLRMPPAGGGAGGPGAASGGGASAGTGGAAAGGAAAAGPAAAAAAAVTVTRGAARAVSRRGRAAARRASSSIDTASGSGGSRRPDRPGPPGQGEQPRAASGPRGNGRGKGGAGARR